LGRFIPREAEEKKDSWRDTATYVAQPGKLKLKTRPPIGSTLLIGKCPRCLWEERVPPWMLFKHASVCSYRCSIALLGKAERLQREEQGNKARRHEHAKRK